MRRISSSSRPSRSCRAAARTVLLLHYFQGLSYQEIGETLGLPVSTVKIRIFRAKKILLEKWHEIGGEGEAPIRDDG